MSSDNRPTPFYRKREDRIERDSNSAKSLAINKKRIVLINILVVFAYILISVRLLDLAISQENYKNFNNQLLTKYELPSPKTTRPDILDRNQHVLATNLRVTSLQINTKKIIDIEDSIEKLNGALPRLSKKDLYKKFNSKKNYVDLARHLKPSEEHRVNQLGIPGLDFHYEDKRYYPYNNLASHILGYVDIDNKGQSGIERHIDKNLPKNKSIQLTIDIRAQHIMTREIKKAISTYQARGGAGIILNAKNGEILSLVSLPDFNPNTKKRRDIIEKEKFNRAISIYEMGSILKIFTAALALESGVGNMERIYDVSHPLRLGRKIIRDLHPKKDNLTLEEIVVYSSNVGASLIASDIEEEYKGLLKEFFIRMGFLKRSPVELPEVVKPQGPKLWGKVNTLTTSYGYGISLNPVQVTTGIATMVNGGYLNQPTLFPIKEKKGKIRKIISEKTSKRIQRIMREVVANENGTGKRADVPGYFVGGKTGTSEKVGINGQYDPNLLMSSFTGIFPYFDPEYIIMVMIDEPKKITKGSIVTGGAIAAPVVKEVIKGLISLLDIQQKIKHYDNLKASNHKI